MLRRFLFYETALNKQFWGFPVSAPGEERVAGATNVAVEAKKENAVEAHLSRTIPWIFLLFAQHSTMILFPC